MKGYPPQGAKQRELKAPDGEVTRTVYLLVLATALIVACSSGSSPTTSTPLSNIATLSVHTPFPTSVPDPTSVAATLLVPTIGHSATPTLVPPPTSIPPSPGSSPGALADRAYGYLAHLTQRLGPRESGTEQELEAAQYLKSQLTSYGYSVDLQTFPLESIPVAELEVALEAADPQRVEATPLGQSGTGNVSGMLCPIGLALPEDIPEEGLGGKIALVKRGQIQFQEKVKRVAQAGAVAAVIYNNLAGSFQGVLLSPGSVPAITISREDGLEIEALVAEGRVEATVSVSLEKRFSRNVVAERGGDDDGIVVLGAHYDTVANTTGANDNASGTAVLLAVARELAGRSLPFGLRFVAFGAEELGLLGSQFYVNSLSTGQQRRTIAMLNFDAVGSGNQLALLGSPALTELAVELSEERQIPVRVIGGLLGAGSDHMSFAAAGIPVITFVTEDFSRLHTPQDRIDFVDPSLLGDAAGVALALLEAPGFLAVLK